MSLTSAQLMTLWQHVLTLSRVQPGENVVVLNTYDGSTPYKSVAISQPEILGAQVSYVEVPSRYSLPDAVLPLLNAADLIIDLAFILDGRMHRCRETGTRVLVILEPPEILERMLPQAEDKQRAIAARKNLARAQVMHVTSAAGTDFYAPLGEFPAMCQYGFADEPGHWDQWPGVFAFTFPNEGGASGTVVLDRGDIVFPFFTYIQSPITLQVENGFIREITGEFDADYMKAFMAKYQDDDVYAISHIGWGLSHNGQWEAMGLYGKGETEGQDGRAFAGNFLFSTGPNTVGGGQRSTPCHLDVPMRHCSVYLDDEPVVLAGRTVTEQRVMASTLARG
jgi:2,5-dihydroxypyridine 5,6-dioxygenase